MSNKNNINLTMIQRYGQLCLCIILTILTAGCTSKANKVHLNRFEQYLFGQSTNVDPTVFRSELINYQPDNPEFMLMLEDFRSDDVVQDIYRTTDSMFHDLTWLEQDLGKALDKTAKCCTGIRYDRFYTLITADIEDYQNRVFCNDHELAISLDHYAVGAMSRYQYFGLPSYIVALSTQEHIVSDCMSAIIREHIVLPEGQLTLLDYAIAEGKVLYMLEKTLPNTADTIRLRYTGDQLLWMKRNIGQVWAWLIENNLIYSTDQMQIRNLIGDAPKTNAFGEGSAPRTTDYIGWQIVSRYMKKTGTSADQLLEETDSRKILTESGWRPN